jgi:transcriptional regulator GlxA family with amidase domain
MILASKQEKSVARPKYQVRTDMGFFYSLPAREAQRPSRGAEQVQAIAVELQALEAFLDQLFPPGKGNNTDRRARKLKDAIDNAAGEVQDSLGKVCSQLQLPLSGRQARRLFKQAAGISMKDYARKRRLISAAKQLQSTEAAIKVIATDAGYRTNHGFRKAFHALFRVSPAEFRKHSQPPSA